MAKLAGGALLHTLPEDPSGALPLHRRLYHRIRDLILDGTLAPGSRLPSSRTLARELHLSRNTVLEAVEQLAAEGYLVGRVGDGTYVASALPDDLGKPAAPALRPSGGDVDPPRLARRARALLGSPIGNDDPGAGAFAVGVPALDVFPLSLWQRLWQRRSRELGPDSLSYGDPAGARPLREAISSYLATARGVRCSPERILVVSGSQQGIDLAARVLLDPGDEAWIEEPGYLGARGALLAAGARLIPVPVDDEGLDPDAGARLAPTARLVYVTPSHQFPTGATMSLSRRLALLDWASSNGAWIVEDDYDTEFRYSGRPLSSLQGLDRAGIVIYVGTFTKVLYPSLRIAYLVVPEALVDSFVAAKSFVDRHTPTLPQLVLVDFLGGGHFGSHLRKMRALYSRRQAGLVAALDATLGPRLRPRPDEAGMHLVVDLPNVSAEREIFARCRQMGIRTSSLSRYYLGPERRGALLLGYACVPEPEIGPAVERLAQAF